ncbi:MAG: glycosyltransferase [Rhizobiaceae bacterium]|nr:glycosyltransferase [Rhizobiaceae bacterium]
MPTITVVTVCYNSAATIEDALLSVKAQSRPDLQHVVIDGGSTDATLDIVRRHLGPCDMLVSEPDDGIYDAMNKGLRVAGGEVIGFLNSDDYFAGPDALGPVAAALDDRALDCAWGDVLQVNAAGRARRLIRGDAFAPWMLSIGVMPPHPAFYARTEKMRMLGGFAKDLRIASDFDFMMRVFADPGLRAEYVPGLVAVMRLGGVSSAGVRAHQRTSREIVEVLKRNGRPGGQFRIAARYPLRVLELARGRVMDWQGQSYATPWFRT